MNIENVKEQLKKKGYAVSCFENFQDAADYLNAKINEKTVGFGDSGTLFNMNLFEKLSTHNEVYDPQHCENGLDFLATAKKCLTTDIFLSSINALTETGEIVNIDGTGNRIAGTLFGHEKVYFVTGINKLVPTLDDAIWRARNIAAPQNAKRLQIRTPCAKKGDHCYNCASPDRICNGMMIYLRKMADIEMEIVLINEPLGI